MTRTLVSTLIAACAFAAFAQPAAAAQKPATPISFAAINLDRADGADIAYRRLENAARAMCGDRSGPTTLVQRRAASRCVDGTLGAAVERLDAPLVTQRHRGQRPHVIIVGR